MDKILICQPIGGINDMLCQIGMCIDYAEKYNRKLIIDTTISDMSDHFSNYFKTNDLGKDIQIKLDKKQIDNLYNDPLFPKYFTVTHGPDLTPLSILFDRDSDEKFLLHRTFGGGLMSLKALKYFQLVNYLAERIKQKKKKLGEYHAILIRHTDYNTDYVTALNEIKELNLTVPLFLFTDNHIVQEYAKGLNFKKLIINENIYKSKETDRPIMHTAKDDPFLNPFEVNDEVLMDLFLSALAEHIYPTYVIGYKNNNQFLGGKFRSGFVNLAIELNNDKKLLNSVLGN